ncbi:hypothetical protein [Trichormus azollae]
MGRKQRQVLRNKITILLEHFLK